MTKSTPKGQEGKKCNCIDPWSHTDECPAKYPEEFEEIVEEWQERVIRELKLLGYHPAQIQEFLATASVQFLLRSVRQQAIEEEKARIQKLLREQGHPMSGTWPRLIEQL